MLVKGINDVGFGRVKTFFRSLIAKEHVMKIDRAILKLILNIQVETSIFQKKISDLNYIALQSKHRLKVLE